MKSFLSRWFLLIVVTSVSGAVPAFAEISELPQRGKPPPVTTNSVPHIRIGVEAMPEINAELLNRVSMIKGIEFRATIVSLPNVCEHIKEDESFHA